MGLQQITPIRASVLVRPLVPTTFTLLVKPANNFPIDLYLLMDLSYSMSDDLDNLKVLGNSLGTAMVKGIIMLSINQINVKMSRILIYVALIFLLFNILTL